VALEIFVVLALKFQMANSNYRQHFCQFNYALVEIYRGGKADHSHKSPKIVEFGSWLEMPMLVDMKVLAIISA
jgi:hypothetical protein